MIRRLSRGIGQVRSAIERHGGGWKGIRSAATRSIKVIRALGWHGFVQRIRAAQVRASTFAPPPATMKFPGPVPLEDVSLDVGIMVHVFYPDLLDELARDFACMPVPFVLMVSVVDEQTKAAAESRFGILPRVLALHVRVVPNRGRDMAPLLTAFSEEILTLDILCHVHTKKSLYAGSEQGRWRRYLVDSLFGSRQRVAWILGMFEAMPRLGMIYPESFTSVPLWAHTWLGNAAHARELGQRLGIDIDTSAYLDYPAGSMFWARVDALRPLYELRLTPDAFPEETGQTDGTIQHALERMLGLTVQRAGMVVGILPAGDSLRLAVEGSRNWETYFVAPLPAKIRYASIDAHVVSFDIFDTLVLRPFLTPAGARAYLAHRVEREFGLDGFAELRTRAEASARARAGHDVNLPAIYEVLARMSETQGYPMDRIRELELDTERRLLRPRDAALGAARAMAGDDRRIVAISDMYLDRGELQDVLPPAVTETLQAVHVSCDTGWRKDTGEAWRHLPGKERTAPAHWLHAGDNEHADVQLPQAMGFLHPVHVLRPAALLDVVPALRGLRPAPERRDRWQDQLWLGLVANRLSDLADTHPQAFSGPLLLEEPETLGYVAFGPIVLDYVTWVARLAVQEGFQKILFLSREGYLLQRIHRRLRASVPALQEVEDTYLLASRRGVGVPTLRNIEDLQELFKGTYTGSLHDLVSARLGEALGAAVTERLRAAVTATEVYLPAMRTQVIERLRGAADIILDRARTERETYLQYWQRNVGDRHAVVADLGYAGTIQTHLARLTGRALEGAYFAVNPGIVQTGVHGGRARARLHDGRDDNAVPSPVMRYNLLMEAVLTSPDGQFSHFEQASDGLRPVYLSNGPDPAAFALVKRVHAGMEAFVADACDVAGEDALSLELDKTLIQEPLRCLGERLWRPGSWFDGLFVEDNYTGRGDVSAIAR
jgi:hypothetical protein